VLTFAKELIVTACVGRWLGPAALAALVLGQTLYNVTGNAPMLGVVTAMETYCGQAFGARRFALLGTTLQRALALSLLVCSGATLLWSKAGPLLAATGQDPTIAFAAGKFTASLAPALAMDAGDQCVRRFLAAQGVARPLMVATVAATCLCPLYLFVFVKLLDGGLSGAAAAWNATQATSLMLVTAVARRHVRAQPVGRKPWVGWSLQEATSGWGDYLRMAAPSVVMICLDWWTFEIIVMLSGLLPNPGE
jgi:MATE family multidrug resistance protein